MKQEWGEIRIEEANKVYNFVVLFNLEEGESVPSKKEFDEVCELCIGLNKAFPLPKKYFIN